MKVDRLIILGAGYTGRELARQSHAAGLSVVGTTRQEETLRFLDDLGATAIPWSHGDDPAPWLQYVGPSTAVVYSIPPLFRTLPDGVSFCETPDDSLNPLIDRTELLSSQRHVLPLSDVTAALGAAGAHRLIYLSSTSVYGDHGGQWIDERSPRQPDSPLGAMRRDIEDYLYHTFPREFPNTAVSIARIVGIYGPGRTIIDRIRSGDFTLVDGGRKVTNRIHVADIASSLLAIVERDPAELSTFNLSDGHPQTLRDLVEFICTELRLPRPPEEPLDAYASRKKDPNLVARWRSKIRVRNDRLRNSLGVHLRYPDVFAGYRELLEAAESLTLSPSDSSQAPG